MTGTKPRPSVDADAVCDCKRCVADVDSGSRWGERRLSRAKTLSYHRRRTTTSTDQVLPAENTADSRPPTSSAQAAVNVSVW